MDIELPKRAPSYEANQAAVLRGFKRLKEKGVSDEEEALEDEVDGHVSKRMKPSEDKPPEDKPPNDGSKTPAEQSNFTYMGMAQ